MEAKLLIDNQWIDAQDGAVFERLHPVSQEVVTLAAAAGIADATRAVESAHAAFKAWRRTGPSERRRLPTGSPPTWR